MAFVALCGSSPYLSREIHRQTIALRAAVAISLNRQEAAPSALDSVEAEVALSLLGRRRDFGRMGDSSELLRVVLEFYERVNATGRVKTGGQRKRTELVGSECKGKWYCSSS